MEINPNIDQNMDIPLLLIFFTFPPWF